MQIDQNLIPPVLFATLVAVGVAGFMVPRAAAQGVAPDHEVFAAMEPQVIEWRRDFHANPELSNREFRTAEVVAKHLKALGMEVKTGVAHTGVVGVLRGGKPGPVVALRADMDALPVKERTDVPFASTATGVYNGNEVPVMHACGHDTHIAILMGVASILTDMKDDLAGTVKFIFQPAEEGAPAGENGGAKMMIEEGVLENPDVDVIFGQHIWATADAGTIEYRKGSIMAASQSYTIRVQGQQTHGSQPWNGVDPIVVSAQIIQGLQTIISRQTELTAHPAVISVGSIHGGVRSNIIPEEVTMVGTIRTFDDEMRLDINRRIEQTAKHIAESAGATADVHISDRFYPVTVNDADLVDEMLPVLRQTAGSENVRELNPITGAEDFSFFANEVPGFFFFLGGKPADVPEAEAAAHHTPDFFVDESGLLLGVKALTNMTLEYMSRRGR